MSQNYIPEFKKKIVRLHEEDGRTYKGITAEYNVSKAAISAWCKQFREECQKSPESKAEYDNMKELLKLKRENEQLRKENLFLKKRRHSLQRKSVRGLPVYRGISGRIWCPLATAMPWNLSECLLQLPETPKVRLLYPKSRSPETD